MMPPNFDMCGHSGTASRTYAIRTSKGISSKCASLPTLEIPSASRLAPKQARIGRSPNSCQSYHSVNGATYSHQNDVQPYVHFRDGKSPGTDRNIQPANQRIFERLPVRAL